MSTYIIEKHAFEPSKLYLKLWCKTMLGWLKKPLPARYPVDELAIFEEEKIFERPKNEYSIQETA